MQLYILANIWLFDTLFCFPLSPAQVHPRSLPALPTPIISKLSLKQWVALNFDFEELSSNDVRDHDMI